MRKVHINADGSDFSAFLLTLHFLPVLGALATIEGLLLIQILKYSRSQTLKTVNMCWILPKCFHSDHRVQPFCHHSRQYSFYRWSIPLRAFLRCQPQPSFYCEDNHVLAIKQQGWRQSQSKQHNYTQVNSFIKVIEFVWVRFQTHDTLQSRQCTLSTEAGVKSNTCYITVLWHNTLSLGM